MADRWRDYAACHGTDPQLWYPNRGESMATAKQICATCMVRAPCLQAGMSERFGIWGGTGERERRRLRGWNDAREKGVA